MVKKVLIADDEEILRELVAATLEGDSRYSLFRAVDGEEALAVARQEKPDLMFLDVMMPKVRGIDVCRQLKTDPRTSQIRIVMLTAMAQQADRKIAEEAGADGYFTKPFSPLEILSKVEEVLGFD